MIWFSFDQDLKTHDREPVDLDGALEIARRYRRGLKPSYETGEEAMAEGSFGFQRHPDYFLEIWLNSQNDAWLRTEVAEAADGWFAKLFRSKFAAQFTANDWDTTENAIRAFCTLEMGAFVERFKELERRTKV